VTDQSLFAGKYRINSARLPGWDYGSPGFYYVTICTRNFQPYFGEVVEGEVILSPIGEIVAEEWKKTERIRQNVKLDEWVIMPNHIHGIIEILATDVVETPRRGVSTKNKEICKSTLKPNSLGSIIGQFKSICTKRIRSSGHPGFAWQPRFYDHIIRNDEFLHEIRRYIRDNPIKWELDRRNPENLISNPV